MAGDWIKMRESLHEDPAVLAMAAELKTRPEHVVGYCHRFWSWVSRNCPDGIVHGVTILSVEAVLNMPGFLSMMQEVGWLEAGESDGKPTLVIPKFDRHLSQGAKARGLEAERKRAVRVRKTSGSQPDRNRTREEKRREDNTSTPKPPPPESESPSQSPADAEWGVVEDALHSLGVGRSLAATASARQSGCTPGAVHELIAHYRSKPLAWAPGALHDRILALRPGQDPTTLWPKLAPVAVHIDTSAAREAVAAKAASERAAGQQRIEASRLERERLEREWGPELDRMKLNEIQELFADIWPNGNPPMAKHLPSKGKVKHATLRQRMLEQISNSTTPA